MRDSSLTMRFYQLLEVTMMRTIDIGASVASLIVFAFLAGGALAATLSTGDGLRLELDNATGAVRSIQWGNEKMSLLPGLRGGFCITDVGKAMRSAEGAANLLKNAGFEEGKDAQGLPTGWGCDSPQQMVKFVTLDEATRHSGKASCRLAPDSEGKLTVGVYQQWIPLEKDAAYRFSGWVKSELKGTSVLIAMSYYSAETKWLDAEYIRIETTDWRQVSQVLSPTDAPKDAVKIRIGLWIEKKAGSSGAAWFDDVAFAKYTPREETLTGPVRAVGQGQFSQSARLGSLEVVARYTAKPDHILVEGEVRDTSSSPGEQALQLAYVLPINAVGWRWGDDIRTSRVIREDSSYRNTFKLAGHEISVYPFSSISGERAGLSLAVPMDLAAPQWTSYSASEGFRIGFDLGLSPHTKKLGRGRASFSFVIYAHEPDWGFRAAAKKYYSIFPQFFVKRTEKEGQWVRSAGGGEDLTKIPLSKTLAWACSKSTLSRTRCRSSSRTRAFSLPAILSREPSTGSSPRRKVGLMCVPHFRKSWRKSKNGQRAMQAPRAGSFPACMPDGIDR